MTEHLVVSGLLRDQLVMTVLQDENGLIQDQLVMTELLVESGHQSVLHAMIVHHVVSGLLRDQLVMTVLQEENGQIQDLHAMSEVQEILVDQIVWKEMTTVSVHSMVQETSLLTRRLSLKMLFLKSFSQLTRQMQLSQLSGKRWVFTHAF
jgi:DNA-binding transcriptional regulator of glucitol operon